MFVKVDKGQKELPSMQGWHTMKPQHPIKENDNIYLLSFLSILYLSINSQTTSLSTHYASDNSIWIFFYWQGLACARWNPSHSSTIGCKSPMDTGLAWKKEVCRGIWAPGCMFWTFRSRNILDQQVQQHNGDSPASARTQCPLSFACTVSTYPR